MAIVATALIGFAAYLLERKGKAVVGLVVERNPEMLISRGFQILGGGNATAALEIFRHPVVKDVAVARLGEGLALKELGRTELALEMLETAAERVTDNEYAFRHLILAYREAKNPTAEFAAIQRMGRRFPNSTFYHNMIGVALVRQGKPEEAIPHLEQAYDQAQREEDKLRIAEEVRLAYRAAGREVNEKVSAQELLAMRLRKNLLAAPGPTETPSAEDAWIEQMYGSLAMSGLGTGRDAIAGSTGAAGPSITSGVVDGATGAAPVAIARPVPRPPSVLAAQGRGAASEQPVAASQPQGRFWRTMFIVFSLMILVALAPVAFLRARMRRTVQTDGTPP